MGTGRIGKLQFGMEFAHQAHHRPKAKAARLRHLFGTPIQQQPARFRGQTRPLIGHNQSQ
jgi:hypothetical protein